MTGAPMGTPAPEPKKRGKLKTFGIGCLGVFAIIVAIGVISSLASSGDTDKPATQAVAAAPTVTAAPTTASQAAVPTKAAATTAPAKAAPTKAPAKPNGPLALGTMAKIGDVEVTVTGARIGQGYPQTAGNQILLVEASVKYVGTDVYHLSSLLQTELYGSDNRKASVTIATDGKGTLDGTLTPGQTIVGEVAFEVAPSAAPYRFRFQKALFPDLAEWTIPAP